MVGSTLRLSSGEHPVVGVMPAELARAGFGADIFTPIVLREGDWLQFRAATW